MSYDGSLKFDTQIDAAGFQKGASKIGGMMKSAISVFAGNLLTKAADSLVGIGKAVIGVGADFEAGMSKVSAISGAAGDDLDRLTEKAKEMGAKTKFSASEAADAFSYMAMAGWKTEEMLDGIEGVMNLAAASGENLASVSDIVTDALTAFGMEAKDAGHFADVLAAASSNSNTNVGMMGETFKYVAPLAGSLGYSAEDCAVAIGLMANAGIKSSQAGTALRSILTRLAKPTDEVTQAMDDLGISMTNDDGTMRSLDELLGDLRESFAGLTEQQKAQYAAAIAGKYGMTGLLAVVNASPEAYDSLSESINNCDGAAEEMAETMLDNLPGAVTIMKSSLEGLGIAIYENISDSLKETVENATGYINELRDAFENGGLEGGVKKVGDVLANLATDIAEKAPEFIEGAANLIKGFVDGIKKNRGKLLEAAKEIVKALAKGFVELLPKSIGDPLKEIFSQIGRSLESGGLKKAIQTIITFVKNLISLIGQIIKVVGPAIVKIIDFIGEHLNVIGPIVLGVIAAFKIFNTVLPIVNSVGNAITNLFNVIMANPILALVAAITGAVIALGSFLLANDGAAAAARNFASAQSELHDSFVDMGERMKNFHDILQSGESSWSDYTDNMFRTEDELQQMQDELTEAQNGITEIVRTATAERRELTDEEILKLDEYIQKQREVYTQMLQLERDKQTAAQERLRYELENYDGSLSGFKQFAADWLATAEESHQSELALLTEQQNMVLAQIKQRHEAQGTLNSQAYQEEYAAAIAQYDALRQSANDHYTEMTNMVSEKYSELSGEHSDFYSEYSDIISRITERQAQYNQDSKKLSDEHKKAEQDALNAGNYDQLAAAQEKANSELLSLQTDYNNDMAGLYRELNAIFSDENKEYLAIMTEMAGEIGSHGGDITGEQKKIIDLLVQSWDSLPEDSDIRGNIEEMLTAGAEALSEGNAAFKDAAAKGPKAVVDAWRDLSNDHAPEEAVRQSNRRTNRAIAAGMDEAAAAAQSGAQQVVDSTASTLENGSGQVAAAAGGVMEDSKEAVRSAGLPGTFAVEAQAATDAAEQTLTAGQGPLQEASLGAGEAVKTGFTEADLQSTYTSEAQAAAEAAENAIGASRPTIQAISQGLGESSKTGLTSANVSGTFSGQATAAKDTYLRVLEATKSAAGSAVKLIGSTTKDTLIDARLSDTSDDVAAGFRKSFINQLQQAAILAKGNTQAIGDKVISVMDSYKSKWSSIGSNIASGISSGISGGVGVVGSSITSLANSMVAKLKKAMQIKSPSRRMRDEVGVQIPAGVAVGVKRATPDMLRQVEISMEELAERMEAAVSNETGRITSQHRFAAQSAALGRQTAGGSGDKVVPINQTVNFNQPIESPVEVQRALRKEAKELAWNAAIG